MRRSYKVMVLVIALTMVFSACGGTDAGSAQTPATAPAQTSAQPAAPTTAAAAKPVVPKTLTVGTIQVSDSFDPTTSFTALGYNLVYDTVLKLNQETGEIEPNLAESWEYTDDTTLKLKIRDDVFFSNGEKLTAEDILFTMSRYVFVNTRWASYYDSVDFDKCVIGNDNTLIIKYKYPFALGLFNLAIRQSAVLCKSYVESTTAEDFWDKPVGTGPYTCVENVSGSHSTYNRKADYWGTMPEAETITLRHYKESTTMFIDYENGAIDAIIDLDSSNLQRVINKEVKDTNYYMAPVFDYAAICLPEYVKYFEDIRVRQAIAHAVDAEAIGEIGYGLMFEKADSTVPKGGNYYKSVGIHEYNPEKAKQLLAEAGYKAGDIKLKFVIIALPHYQKMGEAIQAYLAEVGIEAKVEAYDFPTAVPIFMKNGTDIGIHGTGGGTMDPLQVYDTVIDTSTNGTVRLTDSTINEYLKAGKSSIDPAARKKNYELAQQWMFDNVRQIPLAFVNGANVYNSTKIKSLPALIANNPDLRYVTFN